MGDLANQTNMEWEVGESEMTNPEMNVKTNYQKY